MLKHINMLVGISGVGKSTYIHKNMSDVDMVICPDAVREQLTGSVSDQSKNKEVFEECYRRFDEYLASDTETLWWDATNLGYITFNSLLERLSGYDGRWTMTAVFFEQSRDWKACFRRVAEDILNGKNRSNSLGCRDDGTPIIKSMSDRYVNVVDDLKGFCIKNNIHIKEVN